MFSLVFAFIFSIGLPVGLATAYVRMKKWAESALLILPVLLLILIYGEDQRLAFATVFPALFASAKTVFRRRYRQASRIEAMACGVLAAASGLGAGILNARLWELQIAGFSPTSTGWLIGGSIALLSTALSHQLRRAHRLVDQRSV